LADAERLVAELESRPPTLGRTRLVAIDGPAGSGKTTLAHAVVTRLSDLGRRVELLSLDDLYDGWTGLDPALSVRLVDQVLRPLSSGAPASWQSYDWAAHAFGDWHRLDPPEALVVEGCGAGARAQAPYTTLLVWLETTPQAALSRMVERDGPEVLGHVAAWRASEQRHYALNLTRERADTIIVT
jgi:uridine kinase